jgi:uncharacterized membrane protein YuzA (DUF378 family)
MEYMKRLEPLFLLLVVVGGLNWLLIGLFEFNFVTELFGIGIVASVIYVIVGIAALVLVPRLMEGLTHSGDHGVHAHRA